MEKNVGGLDRQLRILSGAFSGFVSVAVITRLLEVDMVYSLVLGLLAVMLFGTAYTQKCPVCNALGNSTYEE